MQGRAGGWEAAEGNKRLVIVEERGAVGRVGCTDGAISIGRGELQSIKTVARQQNMMEGREKRKTYNHFHVSVSK